MNRRDNGDKWCSLGPRPDVRWLYLLGFLAMLLCGGLAWGQAGVPNGCGPGIPNTLAWVLGQSGIPGGCGPGMAVGSHSVTPPPACGVGALDLSTGCAQLVAFGVLF
jgi:hypothetical protein